MYNSLTENNYYLLVGYFDKEQADRSRDRYAGLMNNNVSSDKLADKLRDKFFAANKNANGVKAVIYDNKLLCDSFCSLANEYHMVDFNGFKELTGNEWRTISHYHTPSGCGTTIIYADGSRYALKGGVV